MYAQQQPGCLQCVSRGWDGNRLIRMGKTSEHEEDRPGGGAGEEQAEGQEGL